MDQSPPPSPRRKEKRGGRERGGGRGQGGGRGGTRGQGGRGGGRQQRKVIIKCY